MGSLVAGAALAVFWAGSRVRRARFDRARADAEYPITGNDTADRTVI